MKYLIIFLALLNGCAVYIIKCDRTPQKEFNLKDWEDTFSYTLPIYISPFYADTANAILFDSVFYDYKWSNPNIIWRTN